MAVNSAIVASLKANPVPPDRECFSNSSEVLQVVQDFMTVNVTNPAEVASDGSSIAQQALNVSNTALATATATAARIPQQRFSQTAIPVPSTGDSQIALTWSPSMPDVNYQPVLTFFGPASTVNNFSWHVVDSSVTVDGCTIRLNNIPVSTLSIKWSVTQLLANA